MNTMELTTKVSEKIRDHLIKQKSICVDTKTGDCVYRGPGGLSCAVGCLIKPHYYGEDLEGQNADNRDVFKAVTASLAMEGIVFPTGDERYLLFLLESWQSYHDGNPRAQLRPYANWVGGSPEGYSPQVQHMAILRDLFGEDGHG